MKPALADLLAPISEAQFFAEYWDRQPLHVRGTPAKFAQVLSWRQINRLLDMTHIWSARSLTLWLDTQPVPPEQFCVPAIGRDGVNVQQPEARKLHDWIKRGASVVMNDVDSLSPGLASVSDALESAGLGKVQANVYISFQSHKAFPTHYDTHDVWAVQVEGEKTWNIWSGRAEWPIAHPSFRNLGQAHHDRARGTLREQVVLKAGDLLYLPRGWYHDALADAPASVHIAYGANAALGMEVLNALVERATQEALFRQPLPRQDGTPQAAFALNTRIAALGQKLAEYSRDPKVLEVLARHVAGYRFSRVNIDIPAMRGLAAPVAAPPGAEEAPAFRVVANGAKPVRRGADWVLKGSGGAIPLAPPEAEAAAWLLGRPDVTEAELRAAHPAVDAAALLQRLAQAGVLAAA
jgi:ribosomal protein L16 Arg81 hydroxylase